MIQNECNVVIIDKEPKEFICLLDDIKTFDLFKQFVRSKISTKQFSMILFGTDLLLNETIYQNDFLSKQTYNIAIQIIPENEIVNDDSLLKVLENSNLQSTSIIPENNNKSTINKSKIPQQPLYRNSPKDSDKLQGAFGEVNCGLCKRQIEFEKYLCMFCNNLILCQNCEKNHSHPVIKLKVPFFSSTFKEIMFQYNNITNPQKRIGVFLKTPELSLSTNLYKNTITMGIFKIRYFTLTISNKSEIDINPNMLTLKVLNQKDLTFTYEENIPFIKHHDKLSIPIKVFSNFENEDYAITLQLFYPMDHIHLFDSFSISPIQISIKIIENCEEDNLWDYFQAYPNYLYLPPSQQKQLMYLKTEMFSDRPMDEIYAILKAKNWDLSKSILTLTS